MLPRILDLAARGALFVVNHSGGKDSQACLISVLAMGIPRDQIIVVHASLGDIEWPGALEKAKEHAEREGLPFLVARAIHADGSPKTFLSMVAMTHRNRPHVPSWPSPNQRQCTSDLKRDPITKVTIAAMKARRCRLVVNVSGQRWDESRDRRQLPELVQLTDKHKLVAAGREAWQWHPILPLTTAQVFEKIAQAGLQPHWAYADGNERLSCKFCIMATGHGAKDIKHAARLFPETLAQYIAMEQATGYRMFFKQSLAELVAEASL